MECGVDGTGTAGGHRMQTVKDPGDVATASPKGKGEATALHLTTTLYELMTALQAVVAAVTAFSGDSTDTIYALAIQPRDGRLVVAGTSDASDGGDFALARYHAITCNGVVATRVGTAGHDTLMGTAGPDVIVGFDGDDTIYGLGGNDLLCGNAGHDTLVGGSGDDMLVGDTGTDVCDGGSHVGKDTASGCESVTGVP
jgi:Ca2+-binding RTX toxin-like protein